jgi:hypothetical protein
LAGSACAQTTGTVPNNKTRARKPLSVLMMSSFIKKRVKTTARPIHRMGTSLEWRAGV